MNKYVVLAAVVIILAAAYVIYNPPYKFPIPMGKIATDAGWYDFAVEHAKNVLRTNYPDCGTIECDGVNETVSVGEFNYSDETWAIAECRYYEEFNSGKKYWEVYYALSDGRLWEVMPSACRERGTGHTTSFEWTTGQAVVLE